MNSMVRHTATRCSTGAQASTEMQARRRTSASPHPSPVLPSMRVASQDARHSVRPSSWQDGRWPPWIRAEQWLRMPRRSGAHIRRNRRQRRSKKKSDDCARKQRRMRQHGAIATLIHVQRRIARHIRHAGHTWHGHTSHVGTVVAMAVTGAPSPHIRGNQGREHTRNGRRGHEQPHGGKSQPCNKAS